MKYLRQPFLSVYVFELNSRKKLKSRETKRFIRTKFTK